MTVVFHFRPDLPLIKLEVGKSGTYWSTTGESTIFPVSLDMDRMYEFDLGSGLVGFSPNRFSRHKSSVRENPFVGTGENSVSAR